MAVDEAAELKRQAVVSEKYEPHFGLLESPFMLTSSPRYVFESRSHTSALEQIRQALHSGEPLVIVTGELGTGKTMLCRMVADCLDARTFVAVITRPPSNRDDLLKQILDEFGVLPRDGAPTAQASHFELVRTVQQFLSSLARLDAHAVIVVDDAHRLPDDVLDQLRSLSNVETKAKKLLQSILVGEPALEAVLNRPDARIRQRVTQWHRLEPLKPEEVRHYIERRLRVAHHGPFWSGVSADDPLPLESNRDYDAWRVPFSLSAMAAVATLSGGVPRLVNVLCDRALDDACRLGASWIEPRAVLAAARSVEFPIPWALRMRERRRWALAAAALVLVGGMGWWTVHRTTPPRPSASDAVFEPARR